jgi:hypothetical protein
LGSGGVSGDEHCTRCGVHRLAGGIDDGHIDVAVCTLAAIPTSSIYISLVDAFLPNAAALSIYQGIRMYAIYR